MMTYIEAKEKVTYLLDKIGDRTFDNEDKKSVERLYREVLDEELQKTSCRDCYKDALLEINAYLIKNNSLKPKRHYKLKNGVVLQLFGKSQVYTNKNLTDEVAEAYLKEFPDQTGIFSRLPSDFDVSNSGKFKNKK